MKEDRQEPGRKDEENETASGPTATLVSAVASSFAGLIVVDNVKKGQQVEIPSLGITLTKDDLRDTNTSGD